MQEKTSDRRTFIKTAGKAGIAAGLSFTVIPSLAGFTGAAAGIGYTQSPLPYGYAALEPAIDALTMEIHYTRHAAGYAKNLAEAVAAEGVNTQTMPIEALLGNISRYSAKMRNNAGGHYNHEMFWRLLSPQPVETAQLRIPAAIDQAFGSMEAFRKQFTDAASGRFGSGWAWLLVTPDKRLVISSTPNQDNPLMDVAEVKGQPVMGLDVWEHAYYLKYQNRRGEYINNWWNLVNWRAVDERFQQAMR